MSPNLNIRLVTKIDEETDRLLREESRESGMPVSERVRRLLKQHLEKQAHARAATTAEGGHDNASQP